MTQPVLFFWAKVFVSGLLIAVISNIAKAYPKWAALLTSLPLVTVLSMVWIYIDQKDLALLETYMKDLLLWLLPSLFFIVAAIYLFHFRVPFVLSLFLSIGALFIGVIIFLKLNIIK